MVHIIQIKTSLLQLSLDLNNRIQIFYEVCGEKIIFDTTEKQINNHIFLNIESILSCNKDIEEMLKDKSLQELKKINIDNGEIGYYYKLFLELLSKWLNNKHNEKHKKIY